ncbi:hypothetical protein D9M70_471140 [compost metagenome]
MAQPADRAFGQQRAHLAPDGAVGDHEGFGDHHAVAVPRRDQRVDLGGPQRDRLLAQHVFSGVGGLDRPFHVLCRRERNIDRIDDVGRQHLLVGAEGMRCGEAVGHRPGFCEVAAGYSRNDAVLRVLNGRHDEVAADPGRGQNSET